MIRNSNHTARLLKGVLVLFSFSLFTGLLGCGYTPPSSTVISIQGPASDSIDPGDSASLMATVTDTSNFGLPDFVSASGVKWTLSGTGCTGAACGVLSNSTTSTVAYTAPASVATAFSATITAISVAKTSVTETVTLSVPVSPGISTTAGALAGGVVGTAYSVTLAEVGGVSPYTWSVTQGSLPAGLSLNASTGAITGVPTAAGSVSFTVTLTDSGSPALTAAVMFTIAIAPPPAITFSTMSLAGGTLGVAYSATVAATGGEGTLTYALAAGSLPAGLSLSSAGAITGKPTAGGTSTFTVKATDAYGDTGTSGSLSIVVPYPSLTITPATLANGTAGVAYSATLSASGGSGSGYTFAVSSGTGLSAVGLSLSSSGAVSGTPTTGETAGTFVVKVTDGAGDTGTATITLTVGYPALTITTTSVPNGSAGFAYSATLSANGGSNTGFTWTLTSGSSSLSALGLSLSSGGVLSGATPTLGTASFAVKVTDSAGDTATASLSVTISTGMTITTTSLPNGTEGTAYSTTLGVIGGTGTGYTWTVTSGAGLSAVGLSLSSGGVVSGTPTAAETAGTFAVKVTDSAGDTATATLAVTINNVLTITTTSLPNATVGVAYSATLSANGGSNTGFTWTLTSGSSSLSARGLSLSNGGVLSGATPTLGTASFTVQVTDSAGDTATATITVTVVYPALTISPATLANGTVGVAYSQTLSANGGSNTGYTWTLTSGSSNLSALGLSLSSGGVLSGATPTLGTASFTVQVTDSAGDTATASLSVTISPVLTFTPSILPAAIAGTAYSQTIQITGGVPPYTVTILTSRIPTWITSLAANGSNITVASGTLGSVTTIVTSGPITLAGTPATTGVIDNLVTPNTPTPVTAGDLPFTTTDSTSPINLTSINDLPLATYAAAGTNNVLLMGTYAFSGLGWMNGTSIGTNQRFGIVGSFTADGNGNITGGEFDSNSDAGEFTYSIIGTYQAYTNQTGFLTIQSPTQAFTPVVYAITLGGLGTGTVATTGAYLEFDGTTTAGPRSQGIIAQQSSTAFNSNVSPLEGGYAFALQGRNPVTAITVSCEDIGLTGTPTPTCGPVSLAGALTFGSGGAILAGEEDVTQGQTTATAVPLTGSLNNSGNTDAYGRLTGAITAANSTLLDWPVNYVAYVVNPQTVFIMSLDSYLSSTTVPGSTLLEGVAMQQNLTDIAAMPFNPSQPFLVYGSPTNAQDFPITPTVATTLGGESTAAIQLLTATPASTTAGSMTGTEIVQLGGQAGGFLSNTSVPSFSYTVDSFGRVTNNSTLEGNAATATTAENEVNVPYLYLVDTNTGFGTATGVSGAGIFVVQPQTATTLNAGTYTWTNSFPNGQTAPTGVGVLVIPDGGVPSTGTTVNVTGQMYQSYESAGADETDGGTFLFGEPVTGTITQTGGLITSFPIAPVGTQGCVTTTPYVGIGYIVSPTEFLCMPYKNGYTSVQILKQ